MKSTFLSLIFNMLLLAMAACGTTPVSTPTFILKSTNTQILPTQTMALTLTPVLPSPSVTKDLPIETPTFLPSEEGTSTPTQTPACVILRYEEYAQFEIIGPSGERVLVDVNDPEKLSSQPFEKDILLTTHTHWDHMNEEFQSTFPGMQLFVQTGVLEAPGVIIQGIASAHNVGDRFKPKDGTNYIYLIEIGDLRIAHFGDIGQETLTDEQLAVLGVIDIAITQIFNPYSEMNTENLKGIHLMDQLQPHLVIPTHLNLDSVKLAVSEWEGYYVKSSNVQICESDLSQDGTKLLLIGDSSEIMTKYVDLIPWGE